MFRVLALFNPHIYDCLSLCCDPGLTPLNPIHKMLSCKQCGAGIQQSKYSTAAFRVFESSKLPLPPAASNVCKGQGSLYVNRGANSDCQTQIFPPSSPNSNWTFQGCYWHMCCYCALRSGLHSNLFLAIGCYECKERKSGSSHIRIRELALVTSEFAKLKLQPSSVCLWAGLSGDLINKIVHSVVDLKELAPVTF